VHRSTALVSGAPSSAPAEQRRSTLTSAFFQPLATHSRSLRSTAGPEERLRVLAQVLPRVPNTEALVAAGIASEKRVVLLHPQGSCVSQKDFRRSLPPLVQSRFAFRNPAFQSRFGELGSVTLKINKVLRVTPLPRISITQYSIQSTESLMSAGIGCIPLPKFFN
jgi:hypothetical protein